MYTRRHYVEEAGTIRTLMAHGLLRKDTRLVAICRKRIESSVKTYAKDNPRFDEARFRTACDPHNAGGVA